MKSRISYMCSTDKKKTKIFECISDSTFLHFFFSCFFFNLTIFAHHHVNKRMRIERRKKKDMRKKNEKP
jgi:hypothetical protein